MDYWTECISQAFDEANIITTDEQIDSVVEMVKHAHEMYGEAHGYDCIPNPLKEENIQLRKNLKIEKEKRICKACNGSGSITSYGVCHSATSQCDKCNGEGKL